MVQEDEDLPYLGLVVRLYTTEKRLILLKSRQLRISWIASALDVHEAMFFKARLIPITAYKEDDAKDQMERCEFVYRGNPDDPDCPAGLPKWMQGRCPMERRKKPHEMEFTATLSLIRAVPEGEENIRGKSVSKWRNEESRSQEKLEPTCGSVIPSLQDHGQAIFISTASEGLDHYYAKMVHDTDGRGNPPPAEHIPTGLEGVTMWRNARNGYLVVRIHYTADPKKRDPAWFARVTRGLQQHQIDREYEIDFKALGGTPALDFFVQNRGKIVVSPFEIPLWWPRFASADYGTTNPYSCHFHAVSPTGRLVTYWEYYSPGALGDHLAAVKAHPDWIAGRIQAYILDASCWAATQQSSTSVQGRTLHALRSIADLHQDHGVYPIPATVTTDAVKVEALAREWHDRDEVGAVIFDTCVYLLQELVGIKWAPKSTNPNGSQKEKLVDRDNHAFDDYTYGVLHYRGPGVDNTVTVVEQTPEAIQAAFSKQKAAAYIERVLTRIEDGDEDPDSVGLKSAWGHEGGDDAVLH